MGNKKTMQYKRAAIPFAGQKTIENKIIDIKDKNNTVSNPNSDDLKKIVSEVIDQVNIDTFKTYLTDIFENYSTRELEEEKVEKWTTNRVRVLDINKWVVDSDENTIDKLTNVYQAFSNTPCNIALIFNRTADSCNVKFAVSNTSNSGQTYIVKSNLVPKAEQVFKGNFPGVIIQPHDKEYISFLSDDKNYYVSIVSLLPGEKSEKFISQTIEKLLDGLIPAKNEEEYTIVLLAEPVSDCSVIEQKICNEYSVLSPYATVQGTRTISDSYNVTSSASKGLSFGGHLGFEAIAGLTVGGHWDSTITQGETIGDSDGISRTYTDYSVKHLLSVLEKETERIEQCKSTGMWNFAAYFFTEDQTMAERITHMYDSLTRGDKSFLSVSAINICPKGKRKEGKLIRNYVSMLAHPHFIKNDDDQAKYFPLEITATTIVSTVELAHAMNFPRKSVPGFPVAECAAFGRNVSYLDEDIIKDNIIEIGKTWHMRHDDGSRLAIDSNQLTSHVFITGSTGSGKSNTVYNLLSELKKKDKKFLVIEPTKGEYKFALGGDDVSVYGTNYKTTKILRINPFSFPEGIPIYAHLDRLINIFNACWPMYAAMPAVLKDAVERAYISAGWNLQTSENEKYGRLFPSFSDVLKQIDIVMNESDYSGDSKGDYKGSLKTRVRSLTNGIFRMVFSCDEISDSELFDENVIIDLSDIGPETTSLIMGMLILKLQEYRKANSAKTNAELNHITVLEEAHNLLRRTSTEQCSESANIVGKSVEMITNAIAEMRTFGECFMIVDQAPGELDQAAIRNTNTKIILRLPDFSDRELVGKSIGLTDNQIVELGRLERGVAAVYQSGWVESVLCKFNKYQDNVEYAHNPKPIENDEFIGILINAINNSGKINELATIIKNYKDLVYKTSLPISVKKQIWEIGNSKEKIDEKELDSIAYDLFNVESLYLNKNKPAFFELSNQINNVLISFNIEIKKEQINTIIGMINREYADRQNGNITNCRKEVK